MISQDLLNFFSAAAIASTAVIIIVYILFLRKWGKMLTPFVFIGIMATIIAGIIVIGLYRRS